MACLNCETILARVPGGKRKNRCDAMENSRKLSFLIETFDEVLYIPQTHVLSP